MADEPRRRLEMEAALKHIKSIQKRQAKNHGRSWRLDVSVPRMAIQGGTVFAIGILVGMGVYVLFGIVFS